MREGTKPLALCAYLSPGSLRKLTLLPVGQGTTHQLGLDRLPSELYDLKPVVSPLT